MVKEITVRTQNELDSIPDDYEGRILIEFGNRREPAVVTKKYKYSVAAFGSVTVRGNASVEAWNNVSVVAYDNASVVAHGNASVEAWNNASVVVHDNASVVAYENVSVVAWNNASVKVLENASVMARDNVSVVAWNNASVMAYENVSIVAYENVSVVAYGNAQVVDLLTNGKLEINNNARIVYYPETILEYLDFHDIKNNNGKCSLFIAVRKNDNEILTFEKNSEITYEISFESEICLSYMDWCLKYVQEKNWTNFCIIECEVELKDIFTPLSDVQTVKAKKIKVIREVPLEECGLYGKILAQRLQNNNQSEPIGMGRKKTVQLYEEKLQEESDV